MGTTIISRCLAFLQILKLSRPEDLVPVRQFYSSRNALLGFGNGTAEIAATDTEFDRDVTLAALAVDEGGPRIQRDVGEFA
jgi:hypothetical protein